MRKELSAINTNGMWVTGGREVPFTTFESVAEPGKVYVGFLGIPHNSSVHADGKIRNTNILTQEQALLFAQMLIKAVGEATIEAERASRPILEESHDADSRSP